MTSGAEVINVIWRGIWRHMKKCLTFYQGVFDVIWCWFLLISELLVRRENHHKSCRCICGFFHHRPRKLSLLGLMAKIKCSICSYQFNIWYAGHRPAHILIWFLAFGQGSEACFTLTTGCLGMALQPSAAHYLTKKIELSLAKVLYKSYMYHLTTIFPDTPGTSAFNFNFSLISRSQLTQKYRKKSIATTFDVRRNVALTLLFQ